ncbi:pentapeptide repeat-containing protein [Burkholderia sp. S-53]|uniref:pentapeptide repeat-containing protein n=1 Tax=Burkholderia sp. S-53 TaxID=2906514 RepID=UPI0021D1E992|nr:pentapeptide repeat-containing protein [Burkholderia sp. S-53]UXU86030.1 pentapeptide repeat-containing protein [Burkholderia sp. S-53]
MIRLSYEESCRRLQERHLEPGSVPPMPDRLPQADDERLGVSFFRTFLGDGENISNLTLPRTFFGRSEINDVRFCNTDLTESNLCWNDFIDVDFAEAVLARSDLRASLFERVRFTGADLSHADLRGSTFVRCDFSQAVMTGVVMTRTQGTTLDLSAAQRQEIAWTDDEGAEPAVG